MNTAQDRWAAWLFRRRYGGDERIFVEAMKQLGAIRDRILDAARIEPGDTVLDVGTGDGLLAFTALRVTGSSGRVIFSDISADALAWCQEIIEESDAEGEAVCLVASADDLHDLDDGSVDVVVCRAVLSYVLDKKRCFEEFHRVLKPGGRLSIAEPINSFRRALRRGSSFLGYDMEPLGEIGRKVRAEYHRASREIRGGDADPMTDFDERDLLRLARNAGFEELRLEYEALIYPLGRFIGWEAFLDSAPNPNAPTLREVIDAALTEAEAEAFHAHMKPLVEYGHSETLRAIAYMAAVRHR